MSQIGEWLLRNFGEQKPQGQPSALAGIPAQAAYQSAQRTGAEMQAPSEPQQPASDQQALRPASTGNAQYQQQPEAPQQQAQQRVFPEDVWKASVEQARQRRMAALSSIAEIAATSKEGDPLVKAMHEQLNAAIPEPPKHFGEAEPQVKMLSEKLMTDDIKREAIARMISSQIQAIDQPIPKGVSPAEHATNLIDKLGGSMLKVTNGVMGTSDAVGETESGRLLGGASSNYWNYRNLFKEGRHLIRAQWDDLQRYKATLVDVAHSMQDASNADFNKLAVVSSPEFAEQTFGGNSLSPYTGKIEEKYGRPIPVTPRITRENASMPITQSAVAPAVRKRVVGPGGRLTDNP